MIKFTFYRLTSFSRYQDEYTNLWSLKHHIAYNFELVYLSVPMKVTDRQDEGLRRRGGEGGGEVSWSIVIVKTIPADVCVGLNNRK